MKIKTTQQNILLKQALRLVLVIAIVVVGIIVLRNILKKPPRIENIIQEILSDPDVEFMKKASSFEEVLDYFGENTIFLSNYDESSYKFPAELRARAKAMGGDMLSQLGFRQSYIGVVENGKFVQEVVEDSIGVHLYFDGYEIRNGNFYAKDSKCYIKRGDEKFEINRRGLNVFVIDKEKHLVATYAFDFYTEENPLSVGNRLKPLFRYLDKVEIVVKEKHYFKLKRKRDKALERYMLIAEEDDLVPAKIVFKDKEYKSQIRLKGDWADHLEGEQWSFRVKLNKSDETLMGMRKFSLHQPRTRNYVGEWLFHELLKDADIIHLQYRFVQVELRIVNEFGETRKDLGLYAIEEFFDKYLVERNHRKESVILKVDEDPMWQERVDFSKKGVFEAYDYYPKLANYDNLNIIPFSEKKVRKDSTLFKYFQAGKELFQGYFEGRLKVSEVFDVEKLAKYNAICNLLGSNHALAPHNGRVYYNPINGRLEPIGFDADAMRKQWYFLTYHRGDEDIKYMEAYARALAEVSDKSYSEDAVHWSGLKEQVANMQSAYLRYRWDEDIINHNRKMMQQMIYPSRSLNIFFAEMDGEYLRLNVENYGKFPVQVNALENANQRVFAKPMDAVVVPGEERVTISFKLAKNYQRLFVNKKKYKVGFNFNSDIGEIRLSYQTLGTDRIRKAAIIPWQENQSDIAAANLLQYESSIHKFEFLDVDEDKQTITCQSGDWRIEKAIIVPKGYTLLATPGFRLELMNQNAKIISYSPLKFLGSKQQPIEIFSHTKRGQGIIVLNVKDTSILKNCKFSNLSSPGTEAWGVSGAVSFYDAPVKISYCSFSENRCEDALNIIKTYFEMDNCVFENTFSDAFDGDFVTGKITNTLFGDLGNDAIDVSGSTLYLENISILAAGDKGLSAGENSQIFASNIIIKNSEIGLAAKDKSTIELLQSLLENNKLAFTAFQKKSEFGPAFIKATKVELKGNQEKHLIENGSGLSLDGEDVETVDNVLERMYGIEFGKKSK